MNTKTLSKTAKQDAKLKSLYLLSLGGDKESYRQFLEGVQLLVKSYISALSITKSLSSEIQEEFTQDVLLLVHRKRASFNLNYPITPWLYAIAKNCIIDKLRGVKNQIINIEYDENIYGEDTTISSAEYDYALKEEVNHLLSHLPEKQQEILYMAKVHGHTSEEIAKNKGVSLSAIKVSIHRAIKSIKAKRKLNEK